MHPPQQLLFIVFLLRIFCCIICTPCCAFSIQPNTVLWKWTARAIAKHPSHRYLPKCIGNRQTISSIFGSDKISADVIVANVEAHIEEDSSSTASLYKDIYSVRIIGGNFTYSMSECSPTPPNPLMRTKVIQHLYFLKLLPVTNECLSISSYF